MNLGSVVMESWGERSVPIPLPALRDINYLFIKSGERHGNPLQYACLENPHGQKNLVGHSPWGSKESGMTE